MQPICQPFIGPALPPFDPAAIRHFFKHYQSVMMNIGAPQSLAAAPLPPASH
jgi:hypothetical protein